MIAGFSAHYRLQECQKERNDSQTLESQVLPSLMPPTRAV